MLAWVAEKVFLRLIKPGEAGLFWGALPRLASSVLLTILQELVRITHLRSLSFLFLVKTKKKQKL